MDDDKPTLSYSRINTFLLCGEAYRLRYVEGIKDAMSASATLGISAHRAAEVNFENKVETQEDVPQDVMDDAFSDKYDEMIVESSFNEKELSEAGTIIRDVAIGKWKDLGYRSVRFFGSSVSPLIMPTHVEHRFRIDMDGPFDITGVIDFIESPESGLQVGDLKFTGSSRKKDAGDWLQGSFYALAASQFNDGALPEEVYMQVIKRNKTRETTYRTAVTKTIDDVDRAIAVADSIANSIEKEVFVPNGLGTWKCSEAYCEFWPCQYVERGL